MKAFSLVLRILATLGAIAAVVLFVLAQGKLAELDGELTSTKQTLASTRGTLEETEATLATTETDLASTRQQLESTESTLETTQNDLAVTRQGLSETRANLEETTAKLEETTQEAAQYRADLVNAEAKLAQAIPAEEADDLRSRIADLEEDNKNLALDLDGAERRYKQLLIREGLIEIDGGQLLNPGELGGEVQVAAVDEETGIIVIAGGPEAGLQKGTEVTLVKGLEAIGRIRVAKVTNGLMIAGVLPGTETDELRSGITVNVLP